MFCSMCKQLLLSLPRKCDMCALLSHNHCMVPRSYINWEWDDVGDCICRRCKEIEGEKQRLAQEQLSRIASYTNAVINILQENPQMLSAVQDPSALNMNLASIILHWYDHGWGPLGWLQQSIVFGRNNRVTRNFYLLRYVSILILPLQIVLSPVN